MMSYILSEDSINSEGRTKPMFRIIPKRALSEPRAAIVRLEGAGAGSTATLRIDGLVCSACAARVRRRLERVEGVREARVDLDWGEACVTFDATRATPATFVQAIGRAALFRPLRRLLARAAS